MSMRRGRRRRRREEEEEEEEMLYHVEGVWPGNVLTETSPYRCENRAARNPVGVLRAIGVDGLNATCKVHLRCSCWLTLRQLQDMGVRTEAEKELIEWDAKGADISSDAQEEQSACLREARGVRVRRTKA